MAMTTGERAKQEADAFKARAWFRDLANEVFGMGEYKDTSGKPLKMRYSLRDDRIHMQEDKRKAERIKRCGTAWSDVTTLEWVCLCDRNHRERDEAIDMMDMLIKQTPDIFNRFDEPENGQRFSHAEVSNAALGVFVTENSLNESGCAPCFLKTSLDME